MNDKNAKRATHFTFGSPSYFYLGNNIAVDHAPINATPTERSGEESTTITFIYFAKNHKTFP